MRKPSLHEDDWEYVRTLLPADLEESAYRTSALIRCRNIPDAASFMRMALAYAVSDLSLKDVAAWASALQVAQITGPGLFYPNGPGQKAVQWRAHVSITPTTGSLRAVELTDDSGGEKFSRHHFAVGDVVLGDRGYATARGVYAVRQQEAHVVVRFNPATLRTCDEKRRRIYLAEQEVGFQKWGQSSSNSRFQSPQISGLPGAIRPGTQPRPLLGFRPVPLPRVRGPEK